jgi:hypothetical protein
VSVTALFISFFEGRISHWIVTNITSSFGTLPCHKTCIPSWDQLVICGLYLTWSPATRPDRREAKTYTQRNSVLQINRFVSMDCDYDTLPVDPPQKQEVEQMHH